MIKPSTRFPDRWRQQILRGLILVGVLATGNFLYAFLAADAGGNPWLYGMLVAMLIFGATKNLSLWYHYLRMTVPQTPERGETFSVDILTTYFPGEPHEMVEKTLVAIGRITYPHTTYLCDEANDPYLIELCAKLGVVHVTRNNRIDAKAGNINNALRQATGEICLILDPDHIPEPDFLDHVAPHFQDPGIGFVQVVQAYYNKTQSLVAKGAAQQTFHFYGPVMMSMNSYGTVNPIGANCTFRRAALDGIGGHAPGLAEDMHTGMLLYAEGWRSVYVPRVVARGQVPSTLTAYYKQQLKWSRGTFDLLWKVYPRIFRSLTWRQRIHYALMPLHYLSGVFYLLGFLIPILSLFLSDTPWVGDFVYFLLLAIPALLSSFVIRFYVQQWLIADDERGFHIVGGILEIVTWWIFTVGFIYSLIGRKVPYLPTPKDDKDVTHPGLILPNLFVGVLSIFAVGYGLPRDFTPFSIVMALFALANAFFMFFSVYLAMGATNRNRVLRDRLSKRGLRVGNHALRLLLWSLDVMTVFVRKTAVPLLLSACFCCWLLLEQRQRNEFDTAGLAAETGVDLVLDSLARVGTDTLIPPLLLSVTPPPDKIFAVDYRKATEWEDSRYVLTRKSMVSDFRAMKAIGVSAIRILRPGIYEHNLLLLAKENDLGVIHAFSMPTVTDPAEEGRILEEWRVGLLETVGRLKEDSSIIAWEIQLPPPVTAELNKGLGGDIRPAWVAPLVVDVKAMTALPVVVSAGASLPMVRPQYVVLANWQNEWRQETVSFDGLLNFSGQKTMAYRALEESMGKDVSAGSPPEINILPSAEPLYPGRRTRYSAMIARGSQWLIAPANTEYTLEWRLIKQDRWGNPVAVRLIGYGPEIYPEVPAQYEQYELLLTASAGEYARSVRIPLNIPLVMPEWDGSARTPVQ